MASMSDTACGTRRFSARRQRRVRREHRSRLLHLLRERHRGGSGGRGDRRVQRGTRGFARVLGRPRAVRGRYEGGARPGRRRRESFGKAKRRRRRPSDPPAACCRSHRPGTPRRARTPRTPPARARTVRRGGRAVQPLALRFIASASSADITNMLCATQDFVFARSHEGVVHPSTGQYSASMVTCSTSPRSRTRCRPRGASSPWRPSWIGHGRAIVNCS